MRTLLYILNLALFPGLATLLSGGSLLLFLDGKAASFLLGVPSARRGEELERPTEGWGWSPRSAAVFSAVLVTLALGMCCLVAARGDLLTLALLFASAEVLPLAALCGWGEGRGAPFLPLAFRTALLRAASFLLLLSALALRFPGGPDISLSSLRGETAFSSLSLWEGPGRPAMAAALGLGALAAVLLVVGDPGWEDGLPYGGGGGDDHAVRLIRAAERGFLAAAFTVLLLGYPGDGAGRLLVWLSAALGWVMAGVFLRAWSFRRSRAGRRRAQWWTALPAFLSLVLAAGASALR